MKRFVSVMLALLCLVLPMTGVCADEVADESIEYFEDGSYCVTEISCANTREALQKTAKKTKTYYTSDDAKAFSLTVHGTFKYDGTTSSCINASFSYAIYDSAWSFISATATKSGATATAIGNFEKKFLGITTATRSLTPTLTCDKDGNLS